MKNHQNLTIWITILYTSTNVTWFMYRELKQPMNEAHQHKEMIPLISTEVYAFRDWFSVKTIVPKLSLSRQINFSMNQIPMLGPTNPGERIHMTLVPITRWVALIGLFNASLILLKTTFKGTQATAGPLSFCTDSFLS